MSDNVQTELELPVIKARFTGTVLQIRKISGLDFLAAKMAETGGIFDLNIIQTMNLFSMHTDLFPLVRDALMRLSAAGMLNNTASRIEPDTPFSKISVSETGSQLLRMRISSAERKQIDSVLVYCPWRTEKVSPDYNISFSDRQIRLSADARDLLISYVGGHKEQFGIDPFSEIKNARIDTSNMPSGYALISPELFLDKESGNFRFAGSQGIDLGYLRDSYKGPILKKIPEEVFQMPPGTFEVKKWRDDLPGEGCGYILPSGFRIGGGILFYGPGLSRIQYPDKARLPDSADCDAAVLISASEGKKYWFVRKTVGLEDFGEKTAAKIVAFHDMSRREIKDAVDFLLEGKRAAKSEDLRVIGETALLLNDDSVLTGRIISGMEEGKDSARKILAAAGSLDDRWKEPLGKAFEKWLCGKTETESPETMEQLLKLISRSYSVYGDDLAGSVISGYGPVRGAELLYRSGAGYVLPGNQMISDAAAELILSGNPSGEPCSWLPDASAAARILGELKEKTGVKDCDGYVLDCGIAETGEGKEISCLENRFSALLEKILNDYSLIEKSPGYGKLAKFGSVFASLSAAVSKGCGIRRSMNLKSETNPIRFCLSLRKLLSERMRIAVPGIKDSEIYGTIENSVSLSDDVKGPVLEFLSYCDEVLPRAADVPVGSGERNSWTDAVFEILKSGSLRRLRQIVLKNAG